MTSRPGRAASPKPGVPIAGLYLRGKSLNPAAVTSALGTVPDRAYQRGDTRRGGNPPWSHGLWMIESTRHVKSDRPERHLAWLALWLEERRPQVRRVLAAGGVDAVCTLFAIMRAGHIEIDLSAKLLSTLGALGIPLSIESFDDLA